MPRRFLIMGVIAALVGVALTLLWNQGGTFPLPDPVARATGPAPATVMPSASPTSSHSTTADPPVVDTPPATDSALRIPGIGLEAKLHAEGLRDGKINPPAGTVMWYTGHDRVAPGSVGTAVIAGHVVARGQPDAFADLADVGVGDEVEVTAKDGTTSTFTVVRAEVVDKDKLTTDADVWGSNSSVARLAIVTCDDAHGFRGDGHRVANFVVIAEPSGGSSA